jgi:hypothetical protein
MVRGQRAMLWFIFDGLIEVITIPTGIWLFRHHRRDAAFMALMLVELLPVDALRDLPFAPSPFLHTGLTVVAPFACLLVWLLTIALYFLRRPVAVQGESRDSLG